MTTPDESESAEKAFHERGLFRAVVAVVGLLTGIWALVGAPKPWEVASDLASNPLPLSNTEIILDASARMGTRFGTATKLDVAAEAVDQYAAGSEHVGLALRRSGGDCGEPSEPVVGFDDRQSNAVGEAAKEQEPGGRANLALAVRSAIGDFAGASFHRPESENKVVIFVGGGDDCGGLAGQEIRAELEQANVKASFHVFAIKVSKKEMKNLKTMTRQLQPVAPVVVSEADSVRELYREVQEDAQGQEPGESSAPPGAADKGSPPPHVRATAGEPDEEEFEPAPRAAMAAPLEIIPEPSEAEDGEEERVEPSEEEKQKEQEEKEKEEEQEGEVGLDTTPAEAPAVEPSGEEELGQAKPSPESEAPAPSEEPADRISSLACAGPMTVLWTHRLSSWMRRASLPLSRWGSCRDSWSSMPS